MKPTPVTRRELFLDKLGEEQTLTAVTNEEKFLKKIGNPEQAVPTPVTEYEKYLYKIGGGEIDVPTPANKNGLKAFLWGACGNEVELPTPVTREEMYWDEYIKKYIEVKTLTGALPLTFTTSETALRSWTLHGADFEKTVETEDTLPLTVTSKGGNAVDWTISGNAEGVGERTKNVFAITVNSETISGVAMNVDVDAGTATLNGTCTASNYAIIPIGYITFDNDMPMYLSGGADGGSNSTWYLYAYDTTAGSRPKKWNGTSTSESVYDSQTSQEILCPAGHRIRIAALVLRNVTVNDIVFKPMLRAADTTPEFIPYGYQIPITVSQDETDKSYDIFIGSAPLGEGESVSLTSTGTDIELFEGENTVSTTLTNKPEMEISYQTIVGVGEWQSDGYYIPIDITKTPENLIDITEDTEEVYGVTYTIDKEAGTITCNGTATQDQFVYTKKIGIWVAEAGKTYTLTGCPSGGSITNRYSLSAAGFGDDEGEGKTATVQSDGVIQVGIWIYRGIVCDNLVFTPKIVLAEEPEVKHYDISIGNSTLREGQSITDTIDIETFTGENTIDSTLTDKPSATIKYKE